MKHIGLTGFVTLCLFLTRVDAQTPKPEEIAQALGFTEADHGGALTVEGGTLVFYINRSFTDQVAGMGNGVKHGIGRKQMLSEVAANLKRIHQQLEK